MQPPTKRLGEMLVETGLISAGQLQEALQYQRMAGGRMGGNLVQLGFISEDVLMDFLAQQTGVPRVNPQHLANLPKEVLKRIPHRLADQLTILPISFKEPKSLVLAMADPSDLNAIDSARFASGMSIEPMVASHSVLKKAIAEAYRNLDAGNKSGHIEVGSPANLDEGLPVSFQFDAIPIEISRTSTPYVASARTGVPVKDPFFDGAITSLAKDPFGLFGNAETPDPGLASPPPPTLDMPKLITSRAMTQTQANNLIESYETRVIVLGLIKLLQKRGILDDVELQKFIAGLLDSGEIKKS
jgi:hypothetical protein